MGFTSLTEVQRETLALFESPGEPRTTTEVADQLDLGRRSTYDRLERLVDHNSLKTKKVGGSGRVWWRPPANARTTPDWSAAAESLIDDVLDSADVGIFVLDEDFEIAWINEATERYFGLDREHVLGRDKRQVIYEQIAPVVDEGDAFAETVLATYDDNTSAEQFECRVRPDDDEARWLEHRSKPIEVGAYAGGRVELYFDITTQRESERVLHETQRRFRSLVDAVEEYAIFMLDPDGYVQTWNEGAKRIKGYTAEEIRGEHFSTFYTEDAREVGAHRENLAAASEHGSVEDEGWRLRADGSRFWADVTITTIRDDDGEISGYVKITRDRTEHRKNRQELRRERNLLEQVQEASPTGIAIFDTEGELRRANQRFTDLLGRGDATASDFSLGDQRPLDADGNPIPYSEQPAPRALSTGEPVIDERIRIDGPDGRTRWLSVNAKPFDGETDGVVVTTTDVTQLKTQAQRLEHQRDDLQSELEEMFARIDDGFFSLDGDLRFTYVNDQASVLLGLSSSEVVGESVWDALETGPKPEAAFEEALETQESSSLEAYNEPLETWFEYNVYPSADGLSVYFQDITERKERKRELETFEQIVETIGDGIYVLDETGDFQLVNDAFVSMTQYERRELIGSHASVVFGEKFHDIDEQAREQFAAGEIPVATFEEDIYTAGNDTITVESRFSRFDVGGGRGRVGVIRDVTERKWFEETMATLYESAQALFDAETTDAVDEVVVEAVSDVIELPGIAVYRYDDAADELYPAAHSIEEGFIRDGELPAVPADDSSITGHVYTSGDVHSFDDVTESPYLQSNATALRGGLFVPIGDYGVLIAGASEGAVSTTTPADSSSCSPRTPRSPRTA
ncbi:PAS domain-containing protein [Haloarculaceae archaeon H-GB11]|nr:PAS domain-containing protein [Haloarculaceae archaeon H-GB11]